LLFQQKGGSASFAKVAPSLNGVDPSCMNSITVSTCSAKYSNILHNTFNGIAHFRNVNNCFNTNIYSYLETSGGQGSNLYLSVVQHQC
jgi:hypothetical protein